MLEMKSLLPIVIFLLGIIPPSAWAQPASSAEFITAYRTAMQEKNNEKLDALTYTVGMSDSDKKQMDSMQQMGFSWNHKGIGTITLQPLPANFQSVAIMNGRKYEPTSPPIGMIQIDYTGTGDGPLNGSQGYAIIDVHYFLVSSKSTDLGWKGPPDKPLSFIVAGWVKDKVQIKAKWNTSGVEQEKVCEGNSGGGAGQSFSQLFMGQHIERITVTSTDDNTNVTLIVSEDNKEIYRSQPLKGKGTIEYRKS
jgi:hypothetical protein